MKTVYIKSAAALAVAALLSACGTVGKDFVAPKGIDTPAFRHAAAGPANQAARLPAAWWTVFGDKALDQLEQRALRDNPNVRAAAQRLVQAQAQLGVTRASQLPTVGVSAGVANTRTSAESPMGATFGHQSIKGNEFSVGANFSYELDLWGRVRRAVEAADAQALAAQDGRDGVMLMLSGQVAATYWQLRGLDADIAILNDALATRRESQQLIEARFNAGLSNELDVSRTRIERANAEADIQEAQRQRNQADLASTTPVDPLPLKPAPRDWFLADQIARGRLSLEWALAQVIVDHPAKVSGDDIEPGRERLATDVVMRTLPGWQLDALGDLVLRRGSGRPRRVVACALDEAGYAVSEITADGYLRLHGAGRQPRHPLWDQFHEGQRVLDQHARNAEHQPQFLHAGERRLARIVAQPGIAIGGDLLVLAARPAAAGAPADDAVGVIVRRILFGAERGEQAGEQRLVGGVEVDARGFRAEGDIDRMAADAEIEVAAGATVHPLEANPLDRLPGPILVELKCRGQGILAHDVERRLGRDVVDHAGPD